MGAGTAVPSIRTIGESLVMRGTKFRFGLLNALFHFLLSLVRINLREANPGYYTIDEEQLVLLPLKAAESLVEIGKNHFKDQK